MKKSLLAIALLLAVSAAPAGAQAKHRHKQKDAVEAAAKSSDDKALEAVSDTTDGYYAADEGGGDTADVDADYDFDDAGSGVASGVRIGYDDPLNFFNNLWLAGVGGVIIAMLIVLFILIALALPVILLIWLLRYLMKRSETKAEMARMAMQQRLSAAQQGQAVPQPPFYEELEYDEFLWKKGIRNVSIGVGLLFLFGFMGADALMGVGLLVACLGGGQMYMARTTGKKIPRGKDSGSAGGDSSQQGQQ